MVEDSLSAAFRQEWGNVQVSAFAPLLTDQMIIGACEALGHVWRSSPFPPPPAVRSQLFRALHPDKSIANAVIHMSAEGSLAKEITASAWCQARSRLPRELLPRLVEQTAAQATAEFPCHWHDLEVYLVDGSTVSMPDEPELVEAFGYADGKHGPSRFPVGRMVCVLHAGARVMTQYRLAPYKTSEVELFHEVLLQIPPGGLWVADRLFSGYPSLALSIREGRHFVVRLHQRRDGKALAKSGKRLAPDQWLVTLKLSDPMRKKYAHMNLPDTIQVRLIRHHYRDGKQGKTLWLLTDLVDTTAYPGEDIIQLYRERWGIETHYAYLKVTLEMSVLRSKTEANIRMEVAAIVLAHNLIWHLICQAARHAGGSPNRISFAAAVKTVLAFSWCLTTASPHKRASIYQQMLRKIGGQKNPERRGRREPRLIKRDRRRYGALRVARAEAKYVA